MKKGGNTPPHKAPTMPSWLSKEAKIEWRRIVRILKSQGTLNEMDRTLILLYCKAYTEYIEVLEVIEDEGVKTGRGPKGILLLKTDKGNIIQNPLIGIRNAAWKRLCDAAKLLGISPSGRAPVQQQENKTKEEKKKERFFKKPS